MNKDIKFRRDSENLLENKSAEENDINRSTKSKSRMRVMAERAVHSPAEKFASKRQNNPVPSGRSLSKSKNVIAKPHVFGANTHGSGSARKNYASNISKMQKTSPSMSKMNSSKKLTKIKSRMENNNSR